MLSDLIKAPMGYNSWDSYGPSVTEDEILHNAEAMAGKLQAFGYEYIVVDIQWYEPKALKYAYNPFYPLCTDEFSRVIPAVNRFPSSAGSRGFLCLSKKIHRMGLKFGIHIMRGIPRQCVHQNTPILGTKARARDIAKSFSLCPWNTDMYGVDPKREGAEEYYQSLIDLYASWEVDFIKIDDICNTRFDPNDSFSAFDEIKLYKKCIDKCPRKIVLSLSPGPADFRHAEELSSNANMFRLTDDVWDRWDDIVRVMDAALPWGPYRKGSVFPDCDMLPIGRLGIREDDRHSRLSDVELQTMMNFWCLMGSPLFIGGSVFDLTERDIALLTDTRLLKIHRLSQNPHQVSDKNGVRIWETTVDGKTVTGIFNLNDHSSKII